MKMTDNAVKHLHELLKTQEAEQGTGLRLMVEKGGCAGWQYVMKFDKPGAGDEVFTQEGVSLIIDRNSLDMLGDSELDYADSLSEAGFKVRNPAASRTCGCGSSFEPKSHGS